uniref:Uncharacterized protein n=1 Tax=viral metagenome TaxID=1070528 RepID=A0A6C0JEC8_9ZZZZ
MPIEEENWTVNLVFLVLNRQHHRTTDLLGSTIPLNLVLVMLTPLWPH